VRIMVREENENVIYADKAEVRGKMRKQDF
jgi:hypothetical protein